MFTFAFLSFVAWTKALMRRRLFPLLIFSLLLFPFVTGFTPKLQTDQPADPLLALVVFLYGWLVAWVFERWGKFDSLPANQKQLVIALVGFVAPLIASFGARVFGEWPAAIGTPEVFTTALLQFLAPIVLAAFAWLSTQIAHRFDQILARAAGKK